MEFNLTFNSILFAFSLTLLAGLATGIGGAIAFFAKKTNTILLSVSLGFSAGVMVYVSFVEILQESKQLLDSELGKKGNLLAIASFFIGILIIAIIDKMVPECDNPHEMHKVEELNKAEKKMKKKDKKLEKELNKGKESEEELKKNKKLIRMGVFSAIVIAIHNLPEGLATFVAALKEPKLGIAIAVAIAIHNIPEGIAVSIPIFYATGSRKKAFIYSFLSGLAEPLGAIIGFILIISIFGIGDTILGVIFAIVSGIMVYISFDELLPAAEEYGEHHYAIYGLISGMAVMAFSLLVV
ncbi:MAG: zinc transporter ZupT [Fusobacteria bacterium]|nr:zinc transporter ZupT [Fusobacteriota bacterium]